MYAMPALVDTFQSYPVEPALELSWAIKVLARATLTDALTVELGYAYGYTYATAALVFDGAIVVGIVVIGNIVSGWVVLLV
jgi:hypothetical protein